VENGPGSKNPYIPTVFRYNTKPIIAISKNANINQAKAVKQDCMKTPLIATVF
jgi:hypothetical protein